MQEITSAYSILDVGCSDGTGSMLKVQNIEYKNYCGVDINVNEIEKAKNESFDKKVIVEEFVEGREFTCDMLGDADGNVSVYAISVKYHTVNTCNNKIAIKLHYNSDYYPNEVYRKIAETGKKCYKTLGFKSSLGHLEILMKEDGTLSPVEIGARSSGYITNPLVSLASGHDYFGDYLNVIRQAIVYLIDTNFLLALKAYYIT